MTSPWITANQIASVLGVQKRAVNLRAVRGAWPHAVSQQDGRQTKLFEVARLPAEIQDELARRSLAVAAPAPADLPAVAEPVEAPSAVAVADWQRACADARAALLAEIERLAATHGTDRAIRAMVSAAAGGTLAPALAALVPVANARSGGAAGSRVLSERTLKRWRARQRETGWVGLLPKAAPAAPEPDWAPHLLSIYRRPPERPLTEVLTDLRSALPADVDMPSYGQARSYLASLPPQVRERGRIGQNAMLALMGHKRRSSAGMWPMDLVTADGHTFKSATQHPITGNPFRAELVSVIDVATRYGVGWSAGLAESTWVVMDAYRHAVERWGVPAAVYTDNGSGFVAEAISGEVLGLWARCGTQPDTSIGGRPQARGKIERAQATLWGPAERKLPTYVGRTADRDIVKRVTTKIERDIKDRGTSRLLMSWTDALAHFAAAVEAYNHRPHSALKRIRDEVTGRTRHQTPTEAMREAIESGWTPSTLPADLLEDLFRPYEIRRTIRGEVRLPWGRYYDHALVPYTGQSVRVGYDIHDGDRVWVRDDAGRLICVAQRDANVIPDVPESKLEHIRDQRAKRRSDLKQQQLDDIEVERRGIGVVVDAAPAPVAADLPKITSIPRPISAPKPIEVPALSAAAVEWQRSAQVVEIRPGASAPAPATEAEVRYARAREIERRAEAGESLTDGEAAWLTKYRTRPEYRVRRDLEDQRAAILAR
ncbi:Mu transposase C-terminal domain-containing protein [Tistrella bauzanensis]|uniref:Mu transposase C-terminal domain-containing protein n=1 Tax=Tistrella TaxID=171436 RepID=UPI0031F6A2F9